MYQASIEITEANTARNRARDWLLDHLDSNGRPADSDERTGWSRIGWALTLVGEQAAGAAVVDWAARNRIGSDGNYLPGFMQGQGYISQYSNYWLGTFVISAWLTGRPEIAMRSMRYLASQQTATGGLPTRSDLGDHPAGICDLLSTAQVGLSALITGQTDIADQVYAWLKRLMALQPSGGLTFTMICQDKQLWKQPDPAFLWSTEIHFDQPRQAFYGPGMAAVFLAPYAHANGRPEAIELARRFLHYNLLGCVEQFTDLASVQACKFGWAVGVMRGADSVGPWREWVSPMVRWFLDRQSPEGSWGPSTFADPQPSIADRQVKTSEHLMELTALISVLDMAEDT
jgi:hypothetical protein